MVEAKEKCSKCKEIKSRKDFIPLSSGAKPRCMKCVDKAGKVNQLKKEIESTSAKLEMLKLKLKELNGTYIPKTPKKEEKVLHEVKRVQTELRMHPRLPIGMKKGKDDVYYFKNGSVVKKQVWTGKYGPYTSYFDKNVNGWKYIGLENLRKQIFGNDSKLGV